MDQEQDESVLQFERILGEGSFGVVYLVKDTETDIRYAVKRISFRGQEKDRQAALKEADILSKIQHHHILQYIESFEDEDCLNIVTEYCDGGDLEVYIHKRKRKKIPERRFVPWIFQIAHGLQYLHGKKILHRDLKTKNIFLMKDLSVKLGDLGIAKVLDLHQSKAESFVGTPSYMSPELFTNTPYNQKSDIWSLGCCIYEMVAFEKAFGTGGLYGVMQKVMSGKLPDLPEGIVKELQELVHSMLQKDPHSRPTADDVMLNSYIMKYRHMPRDLEDDFHEKDELDFNGLEITSENKTLTTNDSVQSKNNLDRSHRKRRPLKRSKTMSSSWRQIKADIQKQEVQSQSYAIARTMGKLSDLKLNKAKHVWDTNSALGQTDSVINGEDLDTFVGHTHNQNKEEYSEDSGTFIQKGTVNDEIFSGQTPEMAARIMVKGLKDRLTSFDVPGDQVGTVRAQVAMDHTPSEDIHVEQQNSVQGEEHKPTKKKKKKTFLQKVSEKKRLSSDGDSGVFSETKETVQENQKNDITLFTRSQQVSFKKSDNDSDNQDEMEDVVVELRRKENDEKWKPFEKRKTTASVRGLVEMVGSLENRTLVMEQIPLLKKELTDELGKDTLQKCYDIMLSVEDDNIIKAVLRDLLGPKKLDQVAESLFILRMMELSICVKD